MNQLSVILRQLAKIAEIDLSIIGPIARQFAKIAEIETIDIVELLVQTTKALKKIPDYRSSLVDSISDSQIYSKNWIIEELNGKHLGNIFMCAGWFSMLLSDSRLNFTRCISIDVDPICETISKILHKRLVKDNWKFQAVTSDIHQINYSGHNFTVSRSDNTTTNLFVTPDTIINTSCEHIENFSEWYDSIPKGKLLILQSNNGFEIPDHTNCVFDLDEFTKQTPMQTLLYSGEKEMPKFTRFMRIGYK